MTRPRIRVDFNEMVAEDLVLLSKDDVTEDSEGNRVELREGMAIAIWDEDEDDSGKRDDLLAEGVAELNKDDGWSAHVKWCCRIGPGGIYNASKVK